MPNSTMTKPRIAVAIPCYQEALTIAKVVADFRRELPEAVVYVYDNRCTDATAEIAARAGAIVRREERPGKGYVVGAIFEQVEEDILVMVDGDDTYEADQIHQLLAPILRGEADMTVGARVSDDSAKTFRPLHLAGNGLVCGIVNLTFGSHLTDVFSGFRAMTREFMRRIHLTSGGFDIETEITLRALDQKQVIVEIPVPYRARPEGSFSKLNTFRDGFRVLFRLFFMIKSYKPLTFFGFVALVLFALAVVSGAASGLLVAGLFFLLSILALALGFILNRLKPQPLGVERLTLKNSGTAFDKTP